MEIEEIYWFDIYFQFKLQQGSEGRSRAMSEYGTPSAREIKSLKETVEGLQVCFLICYYWKLYLAFFLILFEISLIKCYRNNYKRCQFSKSI